MNHDLRFINIGKMYLNLLQIAKNLNCTLITLGSGSDTDRNYWSENMNELSYMEHPPINTDLHAESKASIARMVNLSSYKKQLSLRIFGIFGEGENYLYKLIPNTIAKLLFGIPVVLVRDRLYNYVDVKDLSKFIELFYASLSYYSNKLEIGEIPNIINFCTAKPILLSEIVSFLCGAIGNNDGYFSIIHKEQGTSYSGPNTLLSRHFPKFSFTLFEESMKRQIAYYRGQKDIYDQSLLLKDDYLSYAKKISK